jgi:hypothetical protein
MNQRTHFQPRNRRVAEALPTSFTSARAAGADLLKLRQRIEKHSIPIPEIGCWIWLGAIKSYGYGSIKYRNKDMRANRVSWLAFKGEIPKGLCVLHHCDNPACVNPDHLFLGTLKDNMQDCIKKGRRHHGGYCSIAGCNIKHEAKGMCRKHYDKNRRTRG